MSGNHAEFGEELAATFAEIDRYGQALQPASSTLVLRRSSLRVTEAVMPRAGAVAPTPSERPWSLEAAMEPLPEHPPQPPQRRVANTAAIPAQAIASGRQRSRRAVAGAALLGVLIAGAATALLVRALQRPVAVAPQTSPPAVALTTLRTVTATAASEAESAPTARTFPRGTSSVYLDVHYRGRTAEPLTLMLVSRTASATTVLRRSYVLAPTGEVVIPLDAPSGGFVPGAYTVMAQWRGWLLGSTSFAIA